MALLIYNSSLFLYKIGIYIASLFNKKARLFISGRRNLLTKINDQLAKESRPRVWFHCASLGEFEQGRPVIEAFKKEFPQYCTVLTFFSPSGYEVRKNYAEADYIYYLPLDSKRNARNFVDTVNPELVFFVKYEFWHHFIKKINKNNIPLLSFSTIFRPGQIFFKSYGKFFTRILKRFNYFFVQDDQSKKLLQQIGLNNCEVAGDTRFDRVWNICSTPRELPQVQAFKQGKKMMVIGSCWHEDLTALKPFINEYDMKFILAPHEIDKRFIAYMQREFLKKTVLYSELENVDPKAYDVLIIDNIGLLSSLYRYGDFAYVGGAFGKGLHNILEPATFGIPIFFGNKNYEKFKEAVDLVKLGGASAIGNYEELRSQFRAFTDAKTYEIACEINEDYVKNSLGATEKIINYCKSIRTT